MRIIYILSIAFVMSALQLSSQSADYTISILPYTIESAPAIQAYAYGSSNGKWLIVGGRLDGLHKRQPNASFDLANANTKIYVIDPVSKLTYSAALSTLSTVLQEHLSATNMQFKQSGNYLYVIGGYGYSAVAASKITFPYLTAIDVPNLITAIINNQAISPYFRQINDANFAVTGGHLKKIDATYYLVGGHRFDGNYNPMGMPTYTQQYTNEARRFTITDNSTTINVNFLTPISNAAQLHRRDYNAVAQVLPNGKQGITAFSGVFQPTVNLPYLSPATIDSAGLSADTVFKQYYNHYHCPTVPLFDSTNGNMHTYFFGGIAQYYDSVGTKVQDNNVGFVNAITEVKRDSNGVLTEQLLPITLPGFLGAAAEFIPLSQIAHYSNGVIKLNTLQNDSNLLGYIYGGINSTARNVFFSNQANTSSATNAVFKVYLLREKKTTNAVPELNNSFVSELKIVPNPSTTYFDVQFVAEGGSKITLSLLDAEGKVILTKQLHPPAGWTNDRVNLPETTAPGRYTLRLTANGRSISTQILFR